MAREAYVAKLQGISEEFDETVETMYPGYIKEHEQEQTAWALHGKRKIIRKSEAVKQWLTQIFNQGKLKLQKKSAIEVAKMMRTVRREDGKLQFRPEEWLDSYRIAAFFNTLHAADNNALKQSVIDAAEQSDVSTLDKSNDQIEHEFFQQSVAAEEMADSLIAEIGLQHPVMLDEINLCERHDANALTSLLKHQLLQALEEVGEPASKKENKTKLARLLQEVLEGCPCQDKRLKKYMSGMYSNGREPQIPIPSNKVTLRFISNSEITHFGFRIEYIYYQDKCSCPEQNYIESFGVLLSPGYPEPGQQCLATRDHLTKDCLYRIVGTSGQTIFLNFTEFSLGNGSYLAIFDDSILLANYSWLDNDNGIMHNITSSSSHVRLHVHMMLTFFLNDNQTLFKGNYWLLDNPKPDSSIEIWYILLPIIAVIGIVGLIVAICIFNRRSKREALIDLMQTFNAARRATAASNDYDETSMQSDETNDIWQICHTDLSLDRDALLGSGAFGSVYKAKLNTTSPLCQSLSSYLHDKFTNCTVAVKMLGELANINSKEVFLEEILCMKSVGYCQYLVNMHGYCIRDNDYWLVLEYCAGGDLLKYVRNCAQTEDLLEEFDSFAWQIASGMEYLSSKQLVHRDLAARNILLDDEKRAKIGDFGLCRQLSRDVYVTHGGRLPIKWMAVESIRDHVFTSKSDVWSYGVLLYEMYSFGKEPFEFVAPREVLELLLNGDRLEKPEFCHVRIYNLMKLCWEMEPENRPTFDEIRSVTAEHITEIKQENANYLDLVKNLFEH